MVRNLVLCVMTLLTIGCHRAPFSCRSEYLYPDFLASEQVLTPDPARRCFYGQQVIISWNLNKENISHFSKKFELVLHVRYGTRDHAIFAWPVNYSKGYRVYRLINDEYWCKKGIISFKAELYKEGELLYDWHHHLWAEIINIKGIRFVK